MTVLVSGGNVHSNLNITRIRHHLTLTRHTLPLPLLGITLMLTACILHIIQMINLVHITKTSYTLTAIESASILYITIPLILLGATITSLTMRHLITPTKPRPTKHAIIIRIFVFLFFALGISDVIGGTTQNQMFANWGQTQGVTALNHYLPIRDFIPEQTTITTSSKNQHSFNYTAYPNGGYTVTVNK